MESKVVGKSLGWLQQLMEWCDPMWWIWMSGLLFLLCMIHFLPLELDSDNDHFWDRVLLYVRRTGLIALVGLGFVLPGVIYIGFGALSTSADQRAMSSLVLDWYADMLSNYWTLPLAAIIAGVAINFCWHRYAEPYISNLQRKYRVNQSVDSYSDARDEVGNYITVRYDPVLLFMDGFYFVGKDEKGAPIYIERKFFEETHAGMFAPTRFGKGVEAGIILAQAARYGNTVFMVDPKDDDNAPYILEAEAKRLNRPFIYLDLNPEGKGSWDPFKGGSERDRRSRLIKTFNLEAGGTNADVYKSKERTVVDKVLKSTDGTIRAMLEAATALGAKDELSSFRDGLNEWAQISTFMANRKRKGHSIEQSLLNNAIVYVRGSIGDGVIKRATRAYISELMQEVKRLRHQRTSHCTVFVDEVRFVISEELVDALATVAGFGVNMLLATQSVSDLRNPEDKTIDGKALQQSFETNCQIKFIYRAADVDTAQWGMKLSGTKWIRVARNERLQVNRWGGEKWEKARSMDKVEVPIISENKLLNLPPLVFVLYMPGRNPEAVFTSWITVDKSVCSWKKTADEVAQEAAEVANADLAKAAVLPAATTSLPSTSPAGAPVKPGVRPNPNPAAVKKAAAAKVGPASAPHTPKPNSASTPDEPIEKEENDQ